MKLNKIQYQTSSAYNPCCNGIVERLNRTIGELLRIYKGVTLKTIQEIILTRLNETRHTETKAIPADIANQNSIFHGQLQGSKIQ